MKHPCDITTQEHEFIEFICPECGMDLCLGCCESFIDAGIYVAEYMVCPECGSAVYRCDEY